MLHVKEERVIQYINQLEKRVDGQEKDLAAN